MPWGSGKAFASKHNHKLKGKSASKAASIANAVLRESGDEGKAIRIANWQVNRMKRAGHISDRAAAKVKGRIAHRADGGPLDSGQPAIVGERGPELIVPRQPVDIRPDWAKKPSTAKKWGWIQSGAESSSDTSSGVFQPKGALY